jgi:hypothetical protein
MVDSGLRDVDGDGWTVAAGDCDDLNRGVYPGAEERCNGIDDDCDGHIDNDATDAPNWYDDDDQDGYGDDAEVRVQCAAPGGYSDQAGDCDDRDDAIHPGAEEICNELDDDCDGDIDEGDPPVPTWYSDADGDGYGDPSSGEPHCEIPSGMVLDASDCDDGDGAIHPGAADVCDGIDDDCDGVDEGCEDCGNGVDDDGDALIDCEDSYCAEDPGCLELDCSDGLDDDGDGLVDCNDDDCWGATCHPGGARSTVSRAIWATRGWSSERSFTDGGASCGIGGQARQGFWMGFGDISGTVQVLPPSASSWDTATAITTCTWQLNTVHAAQWRWSSWDTASTRRGLGTGSTVTRDGLVVASGCRLDDDPWFLPQQLWLDSGDTTWAGFTQTTSTGGSWGVPGPRWYAGGSRYGLHTSSWRSSSGHSPGCDGTHSASGWYEGQFRSVGGGSSYSALP